MKLLSSLELWRLATLIFELTRRETWLGGIGPENWPHTVYGEWKDHMVWTLSPEVELGGHRMRVAVISSDFTRVGSHPNHWGRNQRHSWEVAAWHRRRHLVRVYSDGAPTYPGGKLPPIRNIWPTWSGRIAEIELRDGGSTGPVERRDLLIAEAKARLSSVSQIEHTPRLITDARAEAEVEEALEKAR